MIRRVSSGGPIRGGAPILVIALCAAVTVSCADTGQERANIPLYLVGTSISEPVRAVGDLPVTIERAELAFGPLYLCAGHTAGDLCETARMEWLDTAVVDTMSEEAVAVGALSGVTGPVQSWMYDLAISSQLTRSEPYVLEAARDLGDASFVVAGRVSISGVELPFFATVPIQQSDSNELGVPVIRKGTSERFLHEVTGEEESLTLRFDPSTWVSRIDFRPHLEDESCETSSAATVCAGPKELSCSSDGTQIDSRDCSEIGQVCLKGQGCVDELILEAGSEGYRSLAIALTTTGRPEFEWTE